MSRWAKINALLSHRFCRNFGCLDQLAETPGKLGIRHLHGAGLTALSAGVANAPNPGTAAWPLLQNLHKFRSSFHFSIAGT